MLLSGTYRPVWEMLLVGLVALQGAALLGITYRTLGSIGFPIDDAYIYSTYVSNAFQGHPFQYSVGERSGGVTSLAWYLAVSLAYAPIQLVMRGPEGLLWAAYCAGLGALALVAVLAIACPGSRGAPAWQEC